MAERKRSITKTNTEKKTTTQTQPKQPTQPKQTTSQFRSEVRKQVRKEVEAEYLTTHISKVEVLVRLQSSQSKLTSLCRGNSTVPTREVVAIINGLYRDIASM